MLGLVQMRCRMSNFLRTLLNSEMCRCADLFLWKNAEQKRIDALIEMMNNAPVLYGWRGSNDQPTSICSRLNDTEKESEQ